MHTTDESTVFVAVFNSSILENGTYSFPSLEKAISYFRNYVIHLTSYDTQVSIKLRDYNYFNLSYLGTGRVAELNFYDYKRAYIGPETVMGRVKEIVNSKDRRRLVWRGWRGLPYDFRNGPVPGIHKRSNGHCCRRVRTFQERREAENLDADLEMKEYGIKARCNRNFHGLPTSWDDLIAFPQHSWKKHRKHQWK